MAQVPSTVDALIDSRLSATAERDAAASDASTKRVRGDAPAELREISPVTSQVRSRSSTEAVVSTDDDRLRGEGGGTDLRNGGVER